MDLFLPSQQVCATWPVAFFRAKRSHTAAMQKRGAREGAFQSSTSRSALTRAQINFFPNQAILLSCVYNQEVCARCLQVCNLKCLRPGVDDELGPWWLKCRKEVEKTRRKGRH
jgi:hypothetical protein